MSSFLFPQRFFFCPFAHQVRFALLSPVHLSHNLSLDRQVLQGVFPHYGTQESKISLPDVKYKLPSCFHFPENLVCSRVRSIVSSVSIYVEPDICCSNLFLMLEEIAQNTMRLKCLLIKITRRRDRKNSRTNERVCFLFFYVRVLVIHWNRSAGNLTFSLYKERNTITFILCHVSDQDVADYDIPQVSILLLSLRNSNIVTTIQFISRPSLDVLNDVSLFPYSLPYVSRVLNSRGNMWFKLQLSLIDFKYVSCPLAIYLPLCPCVPYIYFSTFFYKTKSRWL